MRSALHLTGSTFVALLVALALAGPAIAAPGITLGLLVGAPPLSLPLSGTGFGAGGAFP